MPVEIRELIVRTTIGKANDRKSSNRSQTQLSKHDLSKIKEEIVRECMNELKDWIRTRADR